MLLRLIIGIVFLVLVFWWNNTDPIVSIDLSQSRDGYSQETIIGRSGDVFRGYGSTGSDEFFQSERFTIPAEVAQSIWAELKNAHIRYWPFDPGTDRDCLSLGVGWESGSNGSYGRDYCIDEIRPGTALFRVWQILRAQGLEQWRVPVVLAVRDYKHLSAFPDRQSAEYLALSGFQSGEFSFPSERK